jgi:20S proteasome alpha/beta subunit
MSLVVAMARSDAVVVAVDSRLSLVDDETRAVNRSFDSEQKYLLLSDRCVIALHGNDAEFAKAILHFLDGDRNRSLRNVTDIVEDIFPRLRERYARLMEGLPDGGTGKPVELDFCVAGLDDGKARVFLVGSEDGFAPHLWSRPLVLGATEVAGYWLAKLWSETLSATSLRQLALWIQVEAANSNRYVGGPIRIITVSPDGFEEELIGSDDPVRDEISERVVTIARGWLMEARRTRSGSQTPVGQS